MSAKKMPPHEHWVPENPFELQEHEQELNALRLKFRGVEGEAEVQG